MNNLLKHVSLWIVLLIFLVLALSTLNGRSGQKEPLTDGDFEDQLVAGNIKDIEVVVKGLNVFQFKAVFKEPVNGHRTISFNKDEFPAEWKTLFQEQGFSTEVKEQPVFWQSMLMSFLPLILVFGVFWFFMLRMQSGSNKAMSFGKSRARLVNHSDKVVTFDDVAGVDEAKEELQEIIEFLKD
ncbi:MAG: cell division protein FtsH, partial [Candidatus Hydrogenedentes bacterium]|nr:cell division protein FtsH [Candidatus Hydrogenedentota bacterium]